MRKLLLIGLLFLATPLFAQEYTANNWASWASVTGAQTNWVLPFNSRTVTIMNGSSVPICVGFNGVVIDGTCNSPGLSNNNHKVFQLPASQWITLNNMVIQSINLRSSSVAASPVSVLVNY